MNSIVYRVISRLVIFDVFQSVIWPLRRLHFGNYEGGLVIEFGSGGSPCPISDILIEKNVDSFERHFETIKIDRPTFFCDVEQPLPFKYRAFDYSISFHLLEHLRTPGLFLDEVKRVSNAGYIETPAAFMERLTNYPFHQSEIQLHESCICIRMKDPHLSREAFNLAQPFMSDIQRAIRRKPFDYHINYYWSSRSEQGGLQFEVSAPDGWSPLEFEDLAVEARDNRKVVVTLRQRVRNLFRFFGNRLISRKRLTLEDCLELLQCPVCKSTEFSFGSDRFTCCGCQYSFGAKGFS